MADKISSDVFFFKLVSGEEIFGKWTGSSDTDFLVTDPMLLENYADESGTRQIVMSRYAPFVSCKGVPIKKSHITIMYQVTGPMITYYNQTVAYCADVGDQIYSDGVNEAITAYEAHTPSSSYENLEEQPKNVIDLSDPNRKKDFVEKVKLSSLALLNSGTRH